VAGVGVGVGVGVAEFPLEPKPLPTEVLAQAAAVIGKATAPVAEPNDGSVSMAQYLHDCVREMRTLIHFLGEDERDT